MNKYTLLGFKRVNKNVLLPYKLPKKTNEYKLFANEEYVIKGGDALQVYTGMIITKLDNRFTLKTYPCYCKPNQYITALSTVYYHTFQGMIFINIINLRNTDYTILKNDEVGHIRLERILKMQDAETRL